MLTRYRLRCGTLRRPLLLSAVIGLVAATSASAALTPIRRDTSESALPRVRAGNIHIPSIREHGWTRVIVRLSQPPLAAWNADRRLSSATTANRLNLRSASSKAYLTQLASAQSAAVAQVRAAIPRAQIEERYSILLDGFAVRLPAKALPKLLGDRGVRLRGGHGRRGPGDEDRRRRYGRRPVEPVPQIRRLLVPARVPEGRQAHDDAEGDRRPRLPGAGARPDE